MLRLLVLLGLAAVCAAKYEHCCSAADRHIVQEEWNEIFHDVESSRVKAAFGKLSLLKLLEKHPELKEKLKATGIEDPESPRFQVVALRMLVAFDNLILLLDDPEALEVALEFKAKQWSTREGFTFEHFKDYGHILDAGLHRLAENYDPMAWKSCFAGIFRKIASRLPH